VTFTRRAVLAAGAAGLASAAPLSRAMEAIAAAAAELPELALSPTDPRVRATMAAFADTIVPGPAGGGDPDPGAVEAGVVDEIYEPFYGASATFAFIHDDLALATPLVLGRLGRFDLALPYEDRERVMANRIAPPAEGGRNPLYLLYIGVATLVYISYYGTARSTAGPDYIGFPPSSEGYYPDHSLGVSFDGMTDDGNPS
jgi:hypothetical protein